MVWSRVIEEWGSTADERAMPMGCDELLPDADDVLHRAIDVDAPADIAFRWLCQMKAAPYSYDFIDNWGRRSPRHLIDGLDNLEVGQRIAVIFTVASFAQDSSITMISNSRAFGAVACTYAVHSTGEQTSRYVTRIAMKYPTSRYGRLAAKVLPAGDWIMMRKQLRTFALLAAKTSADRCA